MAQQASDAAPEAESGGPSAPPEQQVTADTIEDAYVRFILHCNPALPADADTESLREAFRCPPKSGGKAFHPFTIFELVRRFYAKEIRTWTELTMLLGVEPPDPSKDESAQKVAQYGVRLKKWMNAMHVRAFFEYLMDVPNDYWTDIPTDSNPIGHPIRDGVAVEDDMALRALIPDIRPKRGRKRPDEAAVSPPAQRRRPSPSSAADEYRQGLQPWSAHPRGRASLPTPITAGWGQSDTLQTPLSRLSQSAVTPTSRGTFWDDALEPRSAVTPSGPKSLGHRRGAKNVSSAWKPGGAYAGSKQRGRPPIGRTAVDGPSPVIQAWMPTQDANAGHANLARPPDLGQAQRTSESHMNGQSTASPTSLSHNAQQDEKAAQEGPRPARPSISLRVPERQGGSVRLATPPQHPGVMESEKERAQQGISQASQNAWGWQRFAKEATDAYEQASNVPSTGCEEAEKVAEYYFEKMEDRTNVDALVSYFVRSMADSEWVDGDGNPDEPASVEESTALVNAMLQNMYKTSTSPQAFLINLAALAGSMTLVTRRPKYVRLGENDESYIYKCDWEYRFGHVKGNFTMPQYVPRTMWKKPGKKEGAAGGSDGDQGAGAQEEEGEEEEEEEKPQQQQSALTADDWKRKYQALAVEVDKRNRELSNLRTKVMMCLRRE